MTRGQLHGALVRSMLLVGLSVLAAHGEALGLQREVKVRTANYDTTPVKMRRASVKLIQTYSGATQFPMADAEDGEEAKVRRSRVRNINRLNQLLPTYMLEGDLELRNDGRKPVEAVQITAIFLNAFRERIGTDQQSITTDLGSYELKPVRWSRNLQHQEVFETVFVITKVRFEDGLVWVPTEELLLFP